MFHGSTHTRKPLRRNDFTRGTSFPRCSTVPHHFGGTTWN
uniref:Uncharacterized protein n=1 Tax=Siphoviridae sp. ctP6113 TaxID=2826318 RepID=A0A8S5MTS0_9CAUD|nr:MAG TPA: hypothetical protein [Siphoviridae sp. ctP6113]